MRDNLRSITILCIPILIAINFTVKLLFGWLAFGLTLWVSLSLLGACCWALIFGKWSDE